VSSVRKELLNIFNIFSNTLSNLSDEQFNKLLSNSARLEYVENEAKKEIPLRVNNWAFENAAAFLERFNSREEAKEFIDNLKLKKEELISLGKLVNANISNKDSKQRLADKIIEATVGSKLRSEAISCINLGRK
jgi:hypothetical protein